MGLQSGSSKKFMPGNYVIAKYDSEWYVAQVVENQGRSSSREHPPALHDQEGQEPLHLGHGDQQGGHPEHLARGHPAENSLSGPCDVKISGVFIFKISNFLNLKLSQICLNLLF
jgi:hypothetical protein